MAVSLVCSSFFLFALGDIIIVTEMKTAESWMHWWGLIFSFNCSVPRSFCTLIVWECVETHSLTTLFGALWLGFAHGCEALGQDWAATKCRKRWPNLVSVESVWKKIKEKNTISFINKKNFYVVTIYTLSLTDFFWENCITFIVRVLSIHESYFVFKIKVHFGFK